MTEFIMRNSAALIGVVGTLLGVILGAAINQLSRTGKLKIYIRNFEKKIFKKDNYGTDKIQDKINDETSSVTIIFDVDIHNTSSDQKNGREVYLVIRNASTARPEEIKLEIKDLGTIKHYSHTSSIDRLESFNIPAKTLINYKLTCFIGKKNLVYLENSSLYFEFIDNKNKKRRTKIQNV